MTTALEEYQRKYDFFLRTIAQKLKEHIRSLVMEAPNIDRVTARAKEPERFTEKALRLNEDGTPKYTHPLTEIQDQLGARIVVYYREDVDAIASVITRYFQPIEQRELVPESQWAFGYFGRHLVVPLPRDVVPDSIDVSLVPSFFELQIKTLFQHAWSEANHELGYKPEKPLSEDQQRRLAYTAAQAWGADRVFAELRLELRDAP